MDETFHVRRCTLAANGITDFFDVPYHHYIQGACFHQGNIYSVEGFTDDKQNPPGIRVIDPAARCQTLYVNFMEFVLDAVRWQWCGKRLEKRKFQAEKLT